LVEIGSNGPKCFQDGNRWQPPLEPEAADVAELADALDSKLELWRFFRL
jgi:hypothetical protein